MKKKKIIIIVAVVFLVICAVYIALMHNAEKIDKVMSDLDTQTTSDVMNTESTLLVESTTENQTSVNENYSYDDLQKIFLEITPETTLDDFLKIIDNYNIKSMNKEYNTMDGGKEFVYKIAYEDKVAWLSHSDIGDYIQVNFNENKELKKAEYFNTNAWYYDHNDVYTAILENQSNSIIGGTGYYGKCSKTATESNYKEFHSGKSIINYIIDNSEKYLQENNSN